MKQNWALKNSLEWFQSVMYKINNCQLKHSVPQFVVFKLLRYNLWYMLCIPFSDKYVGDFVSLYVVFIYHFCSV